MWRSGGRVNERDVPESQHTIFIRGLPGTMGTEEVREYFEKDYGPCSFDFVKLSPDRTKLYVAVRFESKTTARDVMDKLAKDNEVMGYKIELSWFRDIRRYLAHCAKQVGVRPSRFRGGGGGGGRDRFRSDRDDGYRGVRDRSRSPTRSPIRGTSDRSRSRSRSVRSNLSGERSHSRSRTRSPSRSRSNSSGRLSHQSDQKSLDYSDIMVKKERDLSPPSPKKIKKEKKKKDKKQKRKYSPSPSPVRNGKSDSDMDETLDDNISPSKAQQQQILIGPVKPEQPVGQVYQPFPSRHLPPGSLASQASMIEAPKVNMMGAIPNQQQHLQHQQMVGTGGFRQTFTLDLDPNLKNLDNMNMNMAAYKSDNYGINAINGDKEEMKRSRMESPPPPIRNMPAKSISDMTSPVRETGPLANPVFKEIQRQILQDVRYKAQEQQDDDQFGGLRLSSLSKQRVTDEMRDERIAKLSQDLRDRVNKKKRQLELNYRHDCETFALVTRKLMEKDRSLEDRLKIALLETMKDLEQETMKQLDDYLDQLSIICV